MTVVDVSSGLARRVPVTRWEAGNAGGREDVVATEEPLAIQIDCDVGAERVNRCLAVTMRTPGNDAELVAGLLVADGIVTAVDQIEEVVRTGPSMDEDGSKNEITVRLRAGVSVDFEALTRYSYVSSACGVCGKTSLEDLAGRGAKRANPDGPLVSPERIAALPESIRGAQPAFEATGGLHAAALFDAEGSLVALREDVGRHNAVDKLLGSEFLCGNLPLADSLLLLSGRASYELLQKAVLAGVPIVAAVGAPSTLAVETAQAFGVTLVGFVRGDRFVIYSGDWRLGLESGG